MQMETIIVIITMRLFKAKIESIWWSHHSNNSLLKTLRTTNQCPNLTFSSLPNKTSTYPHHPSNSNNNNSNNISNLNHLTNHSNYQSPVLLPSWANNHCQLRVAKGSHLHKLTLSLSMSLVEEMEHLSWNSNWLIY